TTRAVLGAEMPLAIATHRVWTAAQPEINDDRPSPSPAAKALRFHGMVFWLSIAAKSSVARCVMPLAAMSPAAVKSLEVAVTSLVRWSASAVVVRASTNRTMIGTRIIAATPATTAGHHDPGAM